MDLALPGNKIDGLWRSVSSAITVEAAKVLWNRMLTDLENLAEFDEERDGADKRPEAPTLTRAGLTPANLDGIGRSLTPDDWLTLSLTPV